MKKKVKEKLEPLASAFVKDSVRKLRTVIASDPEGKELRTKKWFF